MGDNGGANWWEPSSAHRSSGYSSSTTTTTSLAANSGGYGWLTESSTTTNTARSSLDLGLDWNQQPLLRNNLDFHEEFAWREKLFTSSNEESLEMNKQIESSRSFSLEESQTESMEETGLATSPLPRPSTFHHLESSSSSSSVFGSPSGILQGFIAPYHQQQQQQNQYEQHLQFSNNAPYWNASSLDVRPSNNFFSLQTQLPTIPTFDDKPKQNRSGAKKDGAEMNNKRGRNEVANSSSLPLPPFKVRKEKMGDRITALQQLVSPFGKTDTASVLSEAIEYIKFLHEQVNVLTTPYLKNGASYQHQHQNKEKGKMDTDTRKQDLRSRGLCLVPVSSTFPVAHESTVDFWTPTFGGTFR